MKANSSKLFQQRMITLDYRDRERENEMFVIETLYKYMH